MKINQKVLLKKSYAKWHLDHPDIYSNGIVNDANYEEETLLHLMCCMDVPLKGKVIARGHSYGVSLVEFKLSNLKMTYWVEPRHVELIR